MPDARIAILTGERGSGKTTTCLDLLARARRLGLDCAGLVSPGRLENGLRVGQDVADIRTGERRRFSFEDGAPAEWTTGSHRFERRVAAWASRRLDSACPCDLLVVDEIGPLELRDGRGWPNAIHVLKWGDYGLGVVVVRPSLVGDVLDALRVGSATSDPARDRGATVVAVTERKRMFGLLETLAATVGQRR
jgi:nucleoside-triphosphatase THEP1